MSTFRNPLVIALFLLSILQANAQDLIVKKDGDEVNAKVLEVTSTFIKYRLTSSMDTTNVLAMNKSDIFYIKYASGFKEIFDTKQPVTAPSTPTNQDSNIAPAYYNPTTEPTCQTPPSTTYQTLPSQNQMVDPTRMPISYDGIHYYQNNYSISESQAQDLVSRRENYQINDMLTKGIVLRKAGSILRYLPAYPLIFIGSLLLFQSGGNSNGASFAAIGGVMMVGGLGFSIGGLVMRSNGRNKISHAISLYNNSIVR